MWEPFSKWTREEKDEFAMRRMDEMKQLNEKYKQRHAEVEKDRKKAEEKNSSITSILGSSKAKLGLNEAETDVCCKPKVKEREWDRGKSNLDIERDWSTHRHFQCRQTKWRVSSAKKAVREQASLRSRSGNSSLDYPSSSRFRSRRIWGNGKKDSLNYRNIFSKQSGRCYNRMNSCGSASSSPSEFEVEPLKQSAVFKNNRLWGDGTNEIHYRQLRVEKWIKSINIACLENVENLSASKSQ